MQDPKNHQKCNIWALSHNFVRLYLCNWGTYRQSEKKLVKQQYVLQMSPQYGELQPTSGWNPLASLRHPCKFQRVSHLGSITARQSSSGRQPNFAALNRGHHLCSAGVTITLGIGPHCSFHINCFQFWFSWPSFPLLFHHGPGLLKDPCDHIYRLGWPSCCQTNGVKTLNGTHGRCHRGKSTSAPHSLSIWLLMKQDTASFMSPPQNQHPVPNPITMATLWNRAGRLYFHPVVCSSSSFFLFFCSPNPSSRRLDVYHTSTDSVALVRI